MEARTVSFALFQNREPRQSGLLSFETKALEKFPGIADLDAPFLVVVFPEEVVSRAPGAYGRFGDGSVFGHGMAVNADNAN